MEDLVRKIESKFEEVDKIRLSLDSKKGIEKSAPVAVELYATLGFCHGFLGADAMQIPNSGSDEFPWPSEVRDNCVLSYAREFAEGQTFYKEYFDDFDATSSAWHPERRDTR